MGAVKNQVVELTGEVVAADTDAMSFVLRVDAGHRVSVPLDKPHRDVVLRALAFRLVLRLRVRRHGMHDASGDVKDIADVVSVDVVDDVATKSGQVPRKSIVDRIAELSAAVPEKSWDKLPRDGARNLDHYLYGAPKVDY